MGENGEDTPGFAALNLTYGIGIGIFGGGLSCLVLPVTEDRHQVRYTASTHDKTGIIQNTTPDALANSARLSRKITANLDNYLYYDYDRQEGAATLLITYGITTQAAIDAVSAARGHGKAVSLLVMKTLNPVAPKYYEICRQYDGIVIAEENLEGDLRRILFGQDKDTAAK